MRKLRLRVGKVDGAPLIEIEPEVSPDLLGPGKFTGLWLGPFVSACLNV